jgi:hypothetical protein
MTTEYLKFIQSTQITPILPPLICTASYNWTQIEALNSYTAREKKYFYHHQLIEFYLLHNGNLISFTAARTSESKHERETWSEHVHRKRESNCVHCIVNPPFHSSTTTTLERRCERERMSERIKGGENQRYSLTIITQ